MCIGVLRDAAGGVERVAIDSWVYDRVPWWRDPVLHQVAFGFCALFFAATLLGFATGGAMRRLAKQPPSPLRLATRVLAGAGCAIGLAAILGVGIGLVAISPFELFVAVPGWLRATGAASIATAPIAGIVLVQALRTREATPLARLHLVLVAAALALFALLAWSYNLMAVSV